ncbi:probable 2-oxoglutarate-dependent dioxygenase SLC1 [Cornus florida]|uniref:probable 2-oxoglutarate-dependent dioxygenase SLC1 n=1 Tax=Cornus florida TaxID=4283 RepID=UPI00289E1058|nr:probable 2-oxoglutarate-dependent dioxygenase SLC1 [Cornus florida]
MSPAGLVMSSETNREDDESQYQKGVKNLCEHGITKVPNKYVLPVSERPNTIFDHQPNLNVNFNLPIIDFAELQGSNRSQVLKSLAHACQHYGFFQLVNHNIADDVLSSMMEVSRRFFELPLEEREKYMSADMGSPVRYGTSFNQSKDGVFCWRDFLKLVCHPLSDVLPHWPSSPFHFRELAVTYANQTKFLFLMVMEAILESLELTTTKNKTGHDDDKDDNILEEFEDGSQLMVVNCYPPCPEPDLTLGIPPHSDYGFLTLLLQDEVEGLQIQFQEKWATVEPIPNAFVINVGDHLEIFSNGKYKSVLHRVVVNSMKSRISVASLHSLPFKSMIQPSSKLINGANPRRYKDTNFSAFLEYIASCEPKKKNFLESRKLN